MGKPKTEHQPPPGLFDDASWAHTQVLHARAQGVEDFDLDAFASYRTIRILTYSSSLRMLDTLLRRCIDADVECVLGHAERAGDVGRLAALQTAITEEVHQALRKLPKDGRERVAQRVREGRLNVQIVDGNVSHAKIYLLSDGPEDQRCVITGSANFSISALLGDQHEVLVRFADDVAWEHFDREYRRVREHSTADIPVGALCERRFDVQEGHDPAGAPVLDPKRKGDIIQLARAGETNEDGRRARRVRELYDIVLPVARKAPKPSPDGTVKMNRAARARFSGIIRHQTQKRKPRHPTFSIDLAHGEATLNGKQWPLESDKAAAGEDAKALVSFWDVYETAFRGNVVKLQREYFTFLSWMFFSPLICTLRQQAALEGSDVIQYPRVGILYGKASSGKTALIELTGRFMFAEQFQGAIRSDMTGQTLRGIESAYQRMPAFFDDVGRERFRDHGHDFIKDETTPEQDETPCVVLAMNAKSGQFPEEITKRCLLIYASAALPGHLEAKRRQMSNTIAQIKTTTHLYRAYLREVIARTREAGEEFDWLETSSTIIAEILQSHGHTRRWAQPVSWDAYAATRYERVREQLRSVLDPSRRHRGHFGPGEIGWRAEKDRIRVRVRTYTHGRPEFNWDDLPTYMLHENESRGGEFVLDTKAVEDFLGETVRTHRWLERWHRRGGSK